MSKKLGAFFVRYQGYKMSFRQLSTKQEPPPVGVGIGLTDEDHRKVAILDFYHATEHISAALGGVYGDGSVKARTKFNNYRGLLLEDPKGIEKVIRSLAHLKK